MSGPSTFLVLQIQLAVLASSWSVQFVQFLVFCFSSHGAPRCPMESSPLVRVRFNDNMLIFI